MPMIGPTTALSDMLFGFIDGGLVFGGIIGILAFGITGQILSLIALIIGILSLMDDLFPFGRQPFLFTHHFFALLGLASAIAFLLWGMLLPFIVLLLILDILKYALKLFRRAGKKK